MSVPSSGVSNEPWMAREPAIGARRRGAAGDASSRRVIVDDRPAVRQDLAAAGRVAAKIASLQASPFWPWMAKMYHETKRHHVPLVKLIPSSGTTSQPGSQVRGTKIPYTFPKLLVPTGAAALVVACANLSKSERSMSSFYWGLFASVVVYTIYKLFQNLIKILSSIAEKNRTVDYNNSAANFIGGLLTVYFKRSHGLRGRLELPEGGVVVVANHPSGGIEAAAIMAIASRPITPLITSRFNHRPLVKRFLDLWGSIYVHFTPGKDRKYVKNDAAIEASVAAVIARKVILIFPFGDIHPPGPSEPVIREGAARIALLANERLRAAGMEEHVSICPVFVYGLDSKGWCRPFGSFLPRPFVNNQVRIKVYQPITPAAMRRMTASEITQVVRPLLSMRIREDARLEMKDEEHDSFAIAYAATQKIRR